MSGVNKFSGEGQGKIHHVVVAENKSSTIPEETINTEWEGYPKWGGWKRNQYFGWRGRASVWITFRGSIQNQQVA